jgi:hypothetical protein
VDIGEDYSYEAQAETVSSRVFNELVGADTAHVRVMPCFFAAQATAQLAACGCPRSLALGS